MKKLCIGYVPNSPDLTHPADRRRTVFWAGVRQHKVVTDLTTPHDIVVLSERADIGYWASKKGGPPRIFDLIDGYLASDSVVQDAVRGVSKVLTKQVSGSIKRFSKFVENLCKSADAVICSTPEQREMILKFNANVHTILDSHDEFPLLVPQKPNRDKEEIVLFWEGLPYTLSNLTILENAIMELETNVQLLLLTDPTFPKYLGKYVPCDTSRYLRKNLKQISQISTMIDWTEKNVVNFAFNSNLGILPVSLEKRMNTFKAENRLLIMWRLGLPVLVSPTHAYSRVINSIDSIGLCNTPQEWRSGILGSHLEPEKYRNQVDLGQEYLARSHSKEQLLASWDRAIESVL